MVSRCSQLCLILLVTRVPSDPLWAVSSSIATRASPASLMNGHAGSQGAAEATDTGACLRRGPEGWSPGTEPPEGAPCGAPDTLSFPAPVPGEAGGCGRRGAPSDLPRAGARIHGEKWPHAGDLPFRGRPAKSLPIYWALFPSGGMGVGGWVSKVPSGLAQPKPSAQKQY